MDQAPCGRCEKVRDLKHGSGLCASCYVRAHQKDVKCAQCGNIRRLKGRGLCAACYQAQPERKEKRNKERRERYAKDPAYRQQTQAIRTRSAAPPHSVRQKQEYDRQRNYGLTPQLYDELMTAQRFACAVCKLTLDTGEGAPKDHKPHVDHCHDTGEVRGILCGACNRGLGCFRESVEVLQSGMEYLRRHGGN